MTFNSESSTSRAKLPLRLGRNKATSVLPDVHSNRSQLVLGVESRYEQPLKVQIRDLLEQVKDLKKERKEHISTIKQKVDKIDTLKKDVQSSNDRFVALGPLAAEFKKILSGEPTTRGSFTEAAESDLEAVCQSISELTDGFRTAKENIRAMEMCIERAELEKANMSKLKGDMVEKLEEETNRLRRDLAAKEEKLHSLRGN